MTGENRTDRTPPKEPSGTSSSSSRAERREIGVELVARLEGSLPLSDVVTRLETVTEDPTLVREILDTAEKRGHVSREDARLRVDRSGGSAPVERTVVTREGDYDCRRCGTSLSTGHFLRLDAGELGPFGSTCVRRVVNGPDEAPR